MPRPDPELLEAAEQLAGRLRQVNINAAVQHRCYVDLYLRHKLHILRSSLLRSAAQLTLVLGEGRSRRELTVIDHGGGLGLTSMLARLAGFGTVIYNDIDSQFLELASWLAKEVGMPAHHYVLGDVPNLERFLIESRIRPDAWLSYDVIEHLADMSAFISWLERSSVAPAEFVFSSGANMFSPRYLMQVLPIQRRAEIKWRSRRRAIVAEVVPTLSADEVDMWAARTRRYRRTEIEAALREWRATGRWNHRILSPTNRMDPWWTNTVDPDTGWWAEHLMNPWLLRRFLADAGYETTVLLGLYGRPPRTWKAMIVPMINALLSIAGPLGITFAAYYTLWGRRRAETTK